MHDGDGGAQQVVLVTWREEKYSGDMEMGRRMVVTKTHGDDGQVYGGNREVHGGMVTWGWGGTRW